MAFCRFSDSEVYCYESTDGTIEFRLSADPFDQKKDEAFPAWTFTDYEEAAQFAERILKTGVLVPSDLPELIRASAR